MNDEEQELIQRAIRRLRQMQQETRECEALGDRVVHNSTDYEEVLKILRQAICPNY
jgi:acetate kinase